MTRSKTQFGGTGAGFVGGLLLGLVVALGVALYVTKAPLPFANKLGKTADKPSDRPAGEVSSPSGEAPDPNKSLYNKDVREGRIGREEPASEPPRQVSPAAPTAPANAAAPVSPTAPASAASPASPATAYYLQTGSFANSDEADQLRARLALAGIEANVLQAEVGGKTMNRVRVGPFSTAEDAYRARTRLTENGFEARLVKLVQGQ